MNPLEQAIEIAGWQPIAAACDVSHQAVRKWLEAGRLPRTEFSEETSYAASIEGATGGEVTALSLIQWSREGWRSTAA